MDRVSQIRFEVCPFMDPMQLVYMGPWVWSFLGIIVMLGVFVGAVLYIGGDKHSRPSADRLRREEAERLAAVEGQDAEPAAELV